MFSTFMGSMVRWLRCHTCLAGWLVALSLWWMCYITFLTTQLGPFYESDILNFLFVGIPARATMFVSMGGVLYACYGWCKKFFVALYGVCIAFFALLTPYALVYKLPISVAVTSIKYTHWVEAQGFMAQLPLGCYVQAMLFCCVAVYSCVLVVHHSQQGGVSRHSVVVGVVGLLLTLFNPVRFYLGGEFVGPEYIYTVIASSHNPLVRIPVKVLEKLHEEASAQAVLAQRPDWRIEHVAPQCNDYILVIGESASAPFMHAYGASYRNTPFLDTIKGDFISHYYSIANNTVQSLSLTLCLSQDDRADYKNNIITLARAAGFTTYWLSNQGTDGPKDSPIAMLGKMAHESKFLVAGDYEHSHTTDAQLLPVLKSFLAKKPRRGEKGRLFVLHLIGSHPPASRHLMAPLHFTAESQDMAAYVQTIEQTDALLASVYELCMAQKRSFSIVYFSDHGQDIGHDLKMRHGSSATSYHVPFVQIDGNARHHTMHNMATTGAHFLVGFAHWLGIEEAHLHSAEHGFFVPTTHSLDVLLGDQHIPVAHLKRR